MGIAAPNAVLIAEGTRRLLGNLFELEDLRPKDLKGIAGPTRAWVALRARLVESRFEALRVALQGLDSLRLTGTKVMLPFFLMTLADIYRINVRIEESFNRLAEAADVIETTQERWAEAEMHRMRGTLLLAMHDVAAAQNSFQQALTVAEHQSAKFWELRAATNLARLWHGQGKRTEARDLLAPVYNWFTEGFGTPVLKEAKALLDELA
jgi:predicted ATPase